MRRIGIVRRLPAFADRYLKSNSFFRTTIPWIAFAEEGLIAVDHDDLYTGLGEDCDVLEAPLERDRAAGFVGKCHAGKLKSGIRIVFMTRIN